MVGLFVCGYLLSAVVIVFVVGLNSASFYSGKAAEARESFAMVRDDYMGE